MGQAARWFVKQGPVSLVLIVAGAAAFTVAAFTLATALGWAVIGGMLWYLEALTSEEAR